MHFIVKYVMHIVCDLCILLLNNIIVELDALLYDLSISLLGCIFMQTFH